MNYSGVQGQSAGVALLLEESIRRSCDRPGIGSRKALQRQGQKGEDGVKRIAILGIIIEEAESAVAVNDLLHEYRDVIIGRMGMPYKERGVSVISIVLDASNDTISALSGKLGMVPGVSAKAVYSKK